MSIARSNRDSPVNRGLGAVFAATAHATEPQKPKSQNLLVTMVETTLAIDSDLWNSMLPKASTQSHLTGREVTLF